MKHLKMLQQRRGVFPLINDEMCKMTLFKSAWKLGQNMTYFIFLTLLQTMKRVY